jgi:hypothetical protein
MRARLVIALGTAALAAAAAVPSHGAAAPKTLDGKKIKKITATASGGLQTNDADNASLDTQNRADCSMPRCYRLDFVYNPAKGVKGNLLFKINWTNPASDFDLYVATAKKAEVAHCGGVGGTGEVLVLPASRFKAGQKYTLVVDFFRSANDTVTATVEFPTKEVMDTSVPAEVDTALPLNCVTSAQA